MGSFGLMHSRWTNDRWHMSKMANAISKVGFYSLGICCFLYAIFARYFAHLHLQLPGLDFPIFVGEIFLLIFSIFLILYLYGSSFRINWWYLGLFVYVVWVLYRALEGYLAYGPLAFRNAALFYYPLFIVFGFHFFKKEYFTQKIIVILLSVLTVSFFLRPMYLNYTYFNFSFCVIFLLLLMRVRNSWVKYLGLILWIYLLVKQIPLNASKSDILSFAASGAFIGICILLGWLKMTVRMKVLLSLLLIALVGYFFATHIQKKSNLVTFLTPMKILEYFSDKDKAIRSKEGSYVRKEIQAVKLYNDEDQSFLSDQAKFAFNKTKQFDFVKVEIQKNIIEVQNVFAEATAKVVANIEAQRKEALTDKTYLLDRVYLKEAIAQKQKEFANKANAFVDSQRAGILSDKASPTSEVILRDLKKAIIEMSEGDLRELCAQVLLRYKADQQKLGHHQSFSTAMNESLINEGPNLLLTRYVAPVRDVETEYYNIAFRLLIWSDMFREMIEKRAIFGLSWGWPQRSRSIEIGGFADDEWTRDGYITPHNSFLHMIYRSGIIGLGLIILLFFYFVKLTKYFVLCRSLDGIFLCGIFLYWGIMSNFLIILEFPYTAIPIWSLFGYTLAYRDQISKK